jgi:hypothetical protein
MKARVIALCLAGAGLVWPQTAEFWPGAVYDPAIPTHRKVLGYEPGERITPHAGLMRYLEALAAAAPGRMKIFEYARSWEGRRLVYAAVGSEANIKRLDEIRAGMKRLADPRRTLEAEARKVTAALPAVIWLGYGVHGNEISSPDAALLTAYHLLAAKNDKLVESILSRVLVLIDPTQNPDGRDRFVHHFEQAAGLEPDPNPVATEHNENWPGGRTNHYYFDLNRDWFALTQPETRGRVRVLQDWFPLVFVDLHEMGSDSTYYFAPEAVPFNPHLTKEQVGSLEWFGKNNARWFDKYGFSYFTREVYDAFYPGYGASWPAYHGSIAMTYEQASARGLVMRRTDETVFTFRDTVRQHFVASISTCETAARERERLLSNFYRYRQTAIEEGSKEPIREYILPRHGDVSLVDQLASLLAEQGVEVRRAAMAFRSANKEYPAGSYVVGMAQPAKRLARVLLDANVAMEDPFVKEQERRRRKRMGDEIYDVTAWSLPMLYNVEAIPSSQVSQGSFEPVKPGPATGRLIGQQAEVAYLAPWGTTAAARFLTGALRAGLRIASTDKGFAQNGRKYPAGTLIVKVKENPANVHELVRKLATSSGVEVIATDSGWVEEGVNFGSRYVFQVRKPAIAIAWDTPTAAYSAGQARFVLERQYEYPVTTVKTSILANADLSRFHVIILPDAGFGAGYASVFGSNGPRRLRDWVSAGGTLIGIGGAVAFLSDSRVGLLAVSQENVARPMEAAKPTETQRRPEGPSTPAQSLAGQPVDSRVPGKIFAKDEDYEKAIQAERELPDAVPGVLVRATTDADAWITAGVPGTVHALVAGRSIFTPLKLDRGINAALFAGPDNLLASGYMWEENRKQLAYKPFVIVQREGRGLVIGFTADPNFRAYMNGLNLLFLNAVFRGPARARPAP